MSYVLGIDLGTSGIKVVLVGQEGGIAATSSAAYPLLKPRPSWVEQNPEDWWQA